MVRILAIRGIFALLLAAPAHATDSTSLRWSESDPRCAFRAEDDGTYRYALTTDQFSVTLAMDAQELDKSRKRSEPVMAFFLSLRSLSRQSPSLAPAAVTLELVRHFRAVEHPIDPTTLVGRLHDRQVRAERTTALAIQKHPEKKEQIEAGLAEVQQETSQMSAWIQTNILTEGGSSTQEIRGWLLFAASGRWIGPLNPQEEFLLRVPIGNTVVEFPFTLPPSRDDIRLRTRPDN
ncbi:MAG TPA: hypothetical protein VF753_13365 [Terriglobales bacterium]